MDIALDDRDVDAFPSLGVDGTVSRAFVGDLVVLRTVVEQLVAEPVGVELVAQPPPLPVHVVVAAFALPDSHKAHLQAVGVQQFVVFHSVIQEEVPRFEESLELLENGLGFLHGKIVVDFQPFDGSGYRMNFFDCLVFRILVEK